MAGSSMSVSMILDMVDRFSGKTGRINQSMNRMSQNGQRAMRALRRSSDLAYNGLDKLGNRYTAFVTGAGGVAAVRNVTQMETRLTRLGIQANRSAEEIENLRKSVVAVAQASDVRVDPSQILDAFDKIIEKTGDFELANGNIRNIGLAIQATGAEGADIGAMVADLSEKFDIKRPDELFATLDLLTNQGKAGAFTLQNLAAQGERVTAAYATSGRAGKMATREMGAMLQMARKGTGSAEQAATAFEGLMRVMNDASKRKAINKLGIQITDPEDPKRMRAITDIVKDLVRAADGDAAKLQGLIGSDEAMRSLNLIAAEYKNTNGFETLDSFMSQSSDGGAILKDAFTAADRSAAKWQTIVTAIKNGVFNKLQAPIGGAADLIGNVKPSTMDNVVGYGLGAMGLLGGLALGVKGHKMAKGFFGRKAGGGLSKTLGGMAGRMAGAQPVMVVNWPLSLGSAAGQLSHGFGKTAGKAGVAARMAGKTGKLARLGRFGKGFAKRIPYIGAGLMALDIGSAALSGRDGALGEALGSTGGAVAGMTAGAAVGSIVPVIGTAIGAALGGVLGSYGGGAIGRFFSRDKENDLSGKIEIKVDAEGRPKVKAAMENSNIDTVVDQGVLMGGAL